MIGTKIYPKKSRSYFFLLMYGILAAAGVVLAARSVLSNDEPTSTAGFMFIFGAGMFILTLIKSRKPQVTVFEDFLELRQSRSTEYVRYRNIVAVSQPDKNRLVVRLWEDGKTKEVVIWLRELSRADVERLSEFLMQKRRKGKE